MLLHFPREAVLRDGYRAGYADLLATLPATTRVTVLAHRRACDDLDELLDAAGRATTATVVPVDDDLRFTVWAQDPCLVLSDGDGETTLLAPAEFGREQDAEALAVLAVGIGARLERSPLGFHGGDVLSGDDFVLVGRTAQALVARGLEPDRRVLAVGGDQPLPDERTRPIRADGRELVEVLPGGGHSPHPLLHLDMFVTLAGRSASGRPRALVGSLAHAEQLLGRPPMDPVLEDHLDDVATQLVDHGFEVHRNPLPLTHGDGRRELDGQVRDVRLWYLATANNCLVQVDAEGGDHVWLPTYGHGVWRELAATDAANRRLWEELGFTVHELTSFHSFAQRFGALHCIVKELARSSPVRTPVPCTGPA